MAEHARRRVRDAKEAERAVRVFTGGVLFADDAVRSKPTPVGFCCEGCQKSHGSVWLVPSLEDQSWMVYSCGHVQEIPRPNSGLRGI